MKKILLFIVIIASTLTISAQNPNIVGTWYLEAYTFDLADPVPITFEDFPQSPTLTINADLSYNGLGACNTFSGNIVFVEDFEYETINFTATTINCANQNYNDSETIYFSHFDQSLSPVLYIYGGGGQLNWEIAPGFGLQFQDTPFLNVANIDTNTFSIFPNPSTKEIRINKQGHTISQITIFNSIGQPIISEIYNGQSIDVSLLVKGIYFLEITSEGKKTTKKFIKE